MNKTIITAFLLICFSFWGVDYYHAPDRNKQKPSFPSKEIARSEALKKNVRLSDPHDDFEEFVHKLRRLQSPEQIEAEITRLSERFNSKVLIDKLNSKSASDEERQLFSVYLKTKLEAYQLLMDMELSDLEARYL